MDERTILIDNESELRLLLIGTPKVVTFRFGPNEGEGRWCCRHGS
jgi:hypothetical protein